MRARIARERFLASRQATIKIQAASRGKHARKGLMELFGRRVSSMGALPLSKRGFTAFTSGVDLTRAMAQGSATTSNRDLKAQKIATERLSNARKNQAVHVQSKQLFASSASRPTPLRTVPGQPATYAATKARDGVRKTLLRDARRLSPLEMFMRVDKIGHSVLRPLACSPMAWLVFLTYAASALGARHGGGALSFPDFDGNGFDGKDSLMTFMIVFYVGYVRNAYETPRPLQCTR